MDRNLPTLAVLAGGFGSRMGLPKASLTLGGKPILAYLLDRLNWQGRTLLVTAPGRTGPAGADAFDSEIVDEVADEGPLRGILTALQHTAGAEVLVTTVDMPAVTPAMLDYLQIALAIRPTYHGVMFQTSTDIQSFPSCYRSSARAAIEQAIAAKRRSVRRLVENPGFVTVPAPVDWSPSVWTNLNTPEDLQAFEKSLAPGDNM